MATNKAVLSYPRKCFAVIGLSLPAMSLMAADLVAYTTEWPPYNYEEKGEIRGVSTEILRATCAEAKLVCEIRLVPWARAYATAQTTPNTLAFATARIPQREKDFLWVGPILPRVTWVYGAAGAEKKINTFKELAAHKVGVIRGEAPIKDLESEGVPASAMVVDSSNALVLRQLSKGWVDAMVDTELGMAWNLREAGMPASSVVKLMKLSDKGAYYFALNLKSDEGVQAKMQSALERLRASGALSRIVGPTGR